MANAWWNSPDSAYPFLQSGQWGDEQMGREAILNLIRGGGMDPTGSSALINLMRGEGYQTAGQMGRAGYLRGLLTAPDDPSLAGYSGLMGYRGGMSQLMQSLMGARLSSAMSNQDFLKQLGIQYLGGKANERYAKQMKPSGWAQVGGAAQGLGQSYLQSPYGLF